LKKVIKTMANLPPINDLVAQAAANAAAAGLGGVEELEEVQLLEVLHLS
jgi:hypothetical protein